LKGKSGVFYITHHYLKKSEIVTNHALTKVMGTLKYKYVLISLLFV